MFRNNKCKTQIIFVDEMKGLVGMDKNLTLKILKLQKGIRPHGIAYHKEKKYYLCCTELDQIKIFNQKFTSRLIRLIYQKKRNITVTNIIT